MGVVRKGRAATGVVGALLLCLVLVLGDGMKPSAVGRAWEMARRRSRSSSGLGIIMTKKLGVGWEVVCLLLAWAIRRLCELGAIGSTSSTSPVCVNGECGRWSACGGIVCTCV